MAEDCDLLTYVPLLIRSSLVSDWERKFCISIAGRMKRQRVVLTEKQKRVLKPLVDRFRDHAYGDLTEDDGADDSGR